MSALDALDRLWIQQFDDDFVETTWCEDQVSDEDKEFVSLEFVEKLWGQYGGDVRFLAKLRDEEEDYPNGGNKW